MTKMNPEIYDEEDGIGIEFPLESGLILKVVMDDEVAQKMIDIIQNKLNARF